MTISPNPDTHDNHGSAIRHRILHMTPAWFAATMGTGILSICLGQFPQNPEMFVAGRVLWYANIVLFVSLLAAYLAKWLLFPRHAERILQHPVISMFFGCIPMGLATIVNGCVIFGTDGAIDLAVILWRIDAILSLLVGVAIPYLMFTRQEHTIRDMSAVWLLPIVASEVAAASGALLMPHFADAASRVEMLFFVMVLWACSVPLALGILVILFLRLVLHKLPPLAMAPTAWLALGPIGTGALGLALLATGAKPVLLDAGLGGIASGFTAACLLGSVLLWGYGLWWLMIATAMTARYLRQGARFHLGWWGYTFPLGVFALATLKIGKLLPIPAIGTFAECLIALLALIWCFVSLNTMRGAIDGRLFTDPAIPAAPIAYLEKGEQRVAA